MQVNQIEIDNCLIDNAVRVSGLYNKKVLIEKALLFFTQQQMKSQKNSVQKIINDFYNSPISELETIEIKSVYQGKVLSLEEMEQAMKYQASLEQLAPALATSFFKDHVLSLGAAAKMSGLSLSEFIAHLTDLDIDVVEADAQTPNELETLESWLS
jgi:predicted HTH domain antitoxin